MEIMFEGVDIFPMKVKVCVGAYNLVYRCI